jgi:Methyltransferase domain
MLSTISMREKLASRVFPAYSAAVEKLNWNARWLESLKSAGEVPFFSIREALHASISERYLNSGNDPVDYLEFGVYRGASIRLWSEMNRNAATRIFGFDSFEGLPETWNAGFQKGAFSTGGKPPETMDPRVQFVVGWFQNSLPIFLEDYQLRHKLVIHNDSDLFSSTLYCLTTLNKLMVPGTIIIFDEFDAVTDEFRALVSYAAAYLRAFKIIGATTGYCQVAIELA